jgi:hypothetical protein
MITKINKKLYSYQGLEIEGKKIIEQHKRE